MSRLRYPADNDPIMVQKGVLWSMPTFKHTFDTDTGIESFSFFVVDLALTTVQRYASDPDELRSWACYACGRAFDLYRCKGVGLRILDDADGPRVEVRLEFLPPWWYNGVTEQFAKQGSVGQSESEGAGDVSSEVSMAG